MKDENQSDEITEEQKIARMPWEELADDQRIERLRYIIKQEQNQTGKLRQETNKLRNLIRRHRHGDDHEVLVSANMVGCGPLNSGYCKSAGPNHKPWF